VNVYIYNIYQFLGKLCHLPGNVIFYPVAHLKGAKGANDAGGKFLRAAKYSNFYY
jgi:hypothetical protein